MENGADKKVALTGVARQGRGQIFSRFGKRPSYSFQERGIRWFLRLLAYLTVGVTIAILITLLADAMTFFQEVSPGEFFLGTNWEPFGDPKSFGALPLIAGTLMVAFGASIVAIPLGIGIAVYLTQYSSRRIQGIVGPIVELLGGIPTVVYGYFALTTLTPLLKNIIPAIETFNALSASIVVGLMILPMIASLSAEALRLVPGAIRNAGYALGMRKFHVVVKIILPAAASGIISSFMLAFARAVGETMAVTLAAGATPNLNFNFLEGIQTITAFIVQISLGDAAAGTLEYYTIYALGLTLFLINFSINFVATRIVHRYREVYE